MLMRCDAPTCKECGSIMIPKDGRHTCVNCGTMADSPPPEEPPFVPRHRYDVPPIPRKVVRETVVPVPTQKQAKVLQKLLDRGSTYAIRMPIAAAPELVIDRAKREERVREAWRLARLKNAAVVAAIDGIIAEFSEGR